MPHLYDPLAPDLACAPEGGQLGQPRPADRTARYLAQAQHCLALAERYRGTQTELTMQQAARSWFLLARLEVRPPPPLLHEPLRTFA